MNFNLATGFRLLSGSFAVLFFAGAGTSAALPQDAAPAVNPAPIQHRFLIVDNGANRLLLVDQRNPGQNWSVEVPKGARDLQLVRPGIVLLSVGTGAIEYRLADGKPDGWKAEGFKNVQSAFRTPDGRTLLCTDSGLVITLDAQARESARVQIQQPALNHCRLLRPAPGGTWFNSCGHPAAILEFNLESGKMSRIIPLPGKGYNTIVRPDGHLLSSVGETASVVELDAAGKTVATFGGKARFPKLGLDFFSGFERRANGNIVAANWLGHGKQGTGPHLVEFDPANQLVWSWADHQAAKQVTNLLLLDPEPAESAP